MIKKVKKYNIIWHVLTILFVSLLIFESVDAHAATYYVSPSGNNTKGDGSKSNPWETISYATIRMSGGDILVLKDGTYTNSSQENAIAPPSGSAANYTIIKAENDWQAIIDGNGFTPYSTYPVTIFNKSYIQIEGIKIKDNDSDVGINIHNSRYIKILRTSIRNGASGTYANNIVISSSHHVLVEDCWIAGEMRYGVIFYGVSYNNILRRFVIRQDYADSNQPKAGVRFYGGYGTPSDNLLQNVIYLDLNYGTSYVKYKGGIAARADATRNEMYGCIVLNVQGDGDGECIFAGYQMCGDTSGEDNEAYNCVAWDIVRSGFHLAASTSGSEIILDGCTAGQCSTGATNPNAFTFTIKNSLFIDNTNANSNNNTESYNCYYPADLRPSGATNYITSDPKLDYIVRVETDSPCYESGENGAHRGANILKRYGVSGTVWGEPGYDQLTEEPLWPWPYEDQIKADFSESNNPPSGAYPRTNNTKRGFCADGQTLTRYIWEYLENPIPDDIYDTDPPAPPTGLRIVK